MNAIVNAAVKKDASYKDAVATSKKVYTRLIEQKDESFKEGHS